MAGKLFLIVGGVLSAAAALLHIAVIFIGPAGYRFAGAGEGMARMAAEGRLYPTAVTLGVAGVLGIWALYAFSGAGIGVRLPLLKTGLAVIAAVYLTRGLLPFAAALAGAFRLTTFWTVSSVICLVFGLAYAIGLVLRWPVLSASAVDAAAPRP